MSEALACPACDQRTLTAAGVGKVCTACGWEDEAGGRDDAERQGVGGVSLTEARANVEAFGTAYPLSEVGGS